MTTTRTTSHHIGATRPGATPNTHWRTVKIADGYLHEELVGDTGWDGYSVTPLPGTIPPAAAVPPAATPTRPLVTSAGCIPTCREDRPHERWECEFLATTDEEWARILA